VHLCGYISVVVTKPAPPDSPVKKPDYSCEHCQNDTTCKKLLVCSISVRDG